MYGVHRIFAKTATVSHGTRYSLCNDQLYSVYSWILIVIYIFKTHYKTKTVKLKDTRCQTQSESHVTRAQWVMLESREQHHIKAINNNINYCVKFSHTLHNMYVHYMYAHTHKHVHTHTHTHIMVVSKVNLNEQQPMKQ